jgi:predicted NUDIX family NTP pyrophosphohydrolase
MAKRSAGILLYRFQDGRLEVFLVHPGGPYWAKKDRGAWSIPKGECTDDEHAFETARREFREETGCTVEGDFRHLTPVKQPGGKIVHAWAVLGDCDAASISSNTFTTEWPPRSGKQQAFPEVDRAGWFDPKTARAKILRGQVGFIEQLQQILLC